MLQTVLLISFFVGPSCSDGCFQLKVTQPFYKYVKSYGCGSFKMSFFQLCIFFNWDFCQLLLVTCKIGFPCDISSAWKLQYSSMTCGRSWSLWQTKHSHISMIDHCGFSSTSSNHSVPTRVSLHEPPISTCSSLNLKSTSIWISSWFQPPAMHNLGCTFLHGGICFHLINQDLDPLVHPVL